MTADRHRDQQVLQAGTPLHEAEGVVILLHGRGASAEDILSLKNEFGGSGLAYLAPQAAGNSWYPYSFLSPRDQNEPDLSSALRKVASVIQLAVDAGVAVSQIVLCGFSQGACLATEFLATHPQRYAGLIAFTGGLIGPPEMTIEPKGDLAGTPVFMGSGDPDPHVPWLRVQQSADALQAMGAVVSTRRYPGRSHTVSADEVEAGKRLLQQAFPVSWKL
jgi:phospholipase/carboxylesterase